MTDATLDDVTDDLERAIDLPADDAVDVLRGARRDLRAMEGDPSIDDERRHTLERRLDQRLREVSRRDEYGGGLGSAMNPEDDDAP